MSAQSRTPGKASANPPTGAGEAICDGRRGGRDGFDAQRLRLVAAMVQAIGQSGYRSTTVADVIGRTHASRKTFYSRFANKQDCFLAAYDLVSARATRRLEEAYLEAEGWPDRVEAAIGALFEDGDREPRRPAPGDCRDRSGG